MRRVLSLLVFFTMLTGSTAAGVAAQEATPASGLADLGLPTLDVTATNTGYEGIPNELEAGRYLVTVTVPDDVEFGAGVAFVQPPEGMTPDAFLAAASGAGPAAEPAGEVPGGTPALAEEASPEAGGPPQGLFDATFAGGTYAPAGQSAEVVLDLTPGEWIAWGDDPSASQEPVIFTVTGEMPSDLPEPESGATLTMGEYVIEVTEGELSAGQQVIKVENIGAQPHFVFVALGPDDLTEEQIEAILEAEEQAQMTGTPPAYEDLEVNPEEDFQDVLGTGTQSTDTAIWVPVTLEAGTYLLICFFPDTEDGLPHAYHGMYNIVEVSE